MDISKLNEEAKKQKPLWIRYFKKNKKSIEKMDVQIHALHDRYSAEIDCLSCGNCCRSLGPRITDKDVDRLAKHFRMKAVDFISQYLRTDEDGDMVFKTMPCPFLGADNYCAVYENRPKACREYPHTDRKKFYQIYMLSVENASTCPIVYKVLQDLTDESGK
ncbi:MAG: YkgJ family cysteine cluster protein [Paludibacter sp.]|jgi:Fe-S-cluster containining protein|nr:YkgJ family cysteine cluster protein [Paludibacter sp.]